MVIVTVLVLVTASCGTRLTPKEVVAQRGSLGAGTGAPGAAANGAAGTATGSGSGASSAAGAANAGVPGATGPVGGNAVTATGGAANTGGGAGAGAPGNTASDVGVTPDSITLGNIATLTGPVPGLFKGAVVGTQAFFAYQNSLGGVHGRKLNLTVADDRLDAGANRSAALDLTPKVFGFVGSFSTSDDGMAEALKGKAVPDVGYALSRARYQSPVNFSPQPLPPGWRTGPFQYFKEKFGDGVVTKMAIFYTDVQVSRDAARYVQTAAATAGWKFVYTRAVEPNEANFTADVVRMRNDGVQGLMSFNDPGTQARIATAMQQQRFSVKLADWGVTSYDQKFLGQAGSAAEGSLVDTQLAMYGGEDSATVPEVALLQKWMRVVAPGFTADPYLAYSWAAARLFVQALQAAGNNPTRASVLTALKGIDNFDSNGLVPPAGPASKRAPSCFMVFEVKGNAFVRAAPPQRGFICDKGPFHQMAS
jgi:ABC-type branched-subunit amino acid transport system substrate-binding protein